MTVKAAPLDAPLLGSLKQAGTPLRGGVFVLANTILGAGMLGLPFAFAACGYVVGSLLLGVFGACSVTAVCTPLSSTGSCQPPAKCTLEKVREWRGSACSER